ncbi:MAG: hypothetical protein KatS3mg085_315 [Candidatus Dojkabacteria bacterium]|nr:MAG: hypothetical protein KatS3mg085_315 [Candidatus Dojkabacteria bacterium]
MNNNYNSSPNYSNPNPNMVPNSEGIVPAPMPVPNYGFEPNQPAVPMDHYEYQKRLRDINLQREISEIERIIPRKKNSSFSSLEFRPKHVHFATQNPQEKVYLLIRRHWITNLGWFLRYTFLAFVPPTIFFILKFFEIETDLVTPRGIFLFLLGFYSLIITNFFSHFFDWYFDPYILTNERIIGYDFKPFTSFSVTEATLDNIEDVQEKSIGPIASLFHYGNIRLLTASEKGEIVFEAVPNPTEVRDIIADVTKIYKKYNLNQHND